MTDLSPDFWEFHETFLRVDGDTRGRPYYRPFWNKFGATRDRAWYQANVAGTYSPSSLDRIVPFTNVVNITGDRYTLRNRHWEYARQSLLYGTKLNVLPLALYLYRDYSVTSLAPISLTDFVGVFRDEFGYSGENAPEFAELFSEEGLGAPPGDYLEDYPGAVSP